MCEWSTRESWSASVRSADFLKVRTGSVKKYMKLRDTKSKDRLRGLLAS